MCICQDLALFLLLTGIDYTASNAVQGQRSFGGQSLHSIGQRFLNPYQQVLMDLPIVSLFTSLFQLPLQNMLKFRYACIKKKAYMKHIVDSLQF